MPRESREESISSLQLTSAMRGVLGQRRPGFDLPPDQRMEGTAATVAIGIDRGADIVRVHDVPEMVRVARMTDKIVRRAG